MFEYHPFQDLSDTARLRTIAVLLFRRMRPQLDQDDVPFAVFRASNLPAAKRHGFYNIEYYGFVIDRRASGAWYFDGETDSIP